MDLRLLQMDDFKRWSDELGIPFEKIKQQAGVAGTRKAKSDMLKGEAPVIRRKLLTVLLDAERKHRAPTMTGSLVVAYQEFCALAARLGEIDRDALIRELRHIRNLVAKREIEIAERDLADEAKPK